MPHIPFEQSWVDAWAQQIRASEEYRAAAQRWEWPLAFAFRADPEVGFPEDRFVLLDLYRGECRDARVATEAEASRAEFVLSGPIGTWREVLDGHLDPIAAVMGGRIRLEKGSVMTLAMHASAAKALVQTVTRVDTQFPDAA